MSERLTHYTGIHGFVVVVEFNKGDEPYVLTSRDGLPFGFKYANQLLKRQQARYYSAKLMQQHITLVELSEPEDNS